MQEDWGEFQDKHLFSQVELSKLLLKAFLGLQKGPISCTFEVAMLCALGDAQCKTREVP